MNTAYLVITLAPAVLVGFSGLGKLRGARIVRIIHEAIGVPLNNCVACACGGDVKGMGPSAFMLTVSVAARALRILAHRLGTAGYP
jgi:hypothetical protein